MHLDIVSVLSTHGVYGQRMFRGFYLIHTHTNTHARIYTTLNAIDVIEHSTQRITIIILLRLMQRFHPRKYDGFTASHYRRCGRMQRTFTIHITMK